MDYDKRRRIGQTETQPAPHLPNQLTCCLTLWPPWGVCVCLCVCVQPTREQIGKTAGLRRRRAKVCVGEGHSRPITGWLNDERACPISLEIPPPTSSLSHAHTHTYTQVGWVPILPVRIDIHLTVKVELDHLFTLTPLSTYSPIPSTHLSFHFFPDPWPPHIFLPQQQTPQLNCSLFCVSLSLNSSSIIRYLKSGYLQWLTVKFNF